MSMTLDLDNLRKLEAAATPGPWEYGTSMCCPDMGWVDGPAGTGKVCPQYQGTKTTHTLDANDAELIAEMRNALPALLADHARLTAEVARLQEVNVTLLGDEVKLSRLLERDAAYADARAAKAEVADLRDDIAAGEQGRAYLRSLVEEAQRGQRKAEAEVARLRGVIRDAREAWASTGDGDYTMCALRKEAAGE